MEHIKIMNNKFDEFLKENPIVKFGDQQHCAALAWNACKEECLKILNKPRQNCDLSWDYCDSRHIKDIEEL